MLCQAVLPGTSPGIHSEYICMICMVMGVYAIILDTCIAEGVVNVYNCNQKKFHFAVRYAIINKEYGDKLEVPQRSLCRKIFRMGSANFDGR